MPQPPVKSAGRVLDLLEFFDDARRPATVMEIARSLGIPQSSTSALLQNLVLRGYCDFDPTTRRYMPTVRVMLLGSWLDAPVFEDGAVIRILSQLGARSGEHILLTMLSGMFVRHIYSIPARRSGRHYIRPGTIRPLGRSGAGNLFLATRPDKQIESLVRRLNAYEPNPVFRIDLATLMAEIALIRQRGYSIALDKVTSGVGGVNVLLPKLGQSPPMSVAISSLSHIVSAQHEEYFVLIRDAVSEHLRTSLPPLRQ